MSPLYSKIEPYERGMLDVGDGQRVYWEACGNPKGKPALFIHGGPGAGCSVNSRRFFSPKSYRTVLFDQRGCGRSTPHASDPDSDLSTNTTPHLLADIEALRIHLAIDRWVIFGSAWGATWLSPMPRLIRRGCGRWSWPASRSARPAISIGSITGSAGFSPMPGRIFLAGSGAEDPDADLVEAYHRVRNPNPEIRDAAARAWCDPKTPKPQNPKTPNVIDLTSICKKTKDIGND